MCIVSIVLIITLSVAFPEIIFESRGIPGYQNNENALPTVLKKSLFDKVEPSSCLMIDNPILICFIRPAQHTRL
jgi:hypothetical protein